MTIEKEYPLAFGPKGGRFGHGSMSLSTSPEQLAEWFWDMSDEDQARFFNHLGERAAGKLDFQIRYMIDSNNLNAVGAGVMHTLGEYAKAWSERPILARATLKEFDEQG